MENSALKHGLLLKKVHRLISFNQDEWLKPYIEMSNKLRTKAKYEFEKDFLKLMNKSVFGKLWRTKENTETLNFSQVKKEEIIWSQSQIITPQKVFT